MKKEELIEKALYHKFNSVSRIWKTDLVCLENNNICSYLTKKESSKLNKLIIKRKKFFNINRDWAEMVVGICSTPILFFKGITDEEAAKLVISPFNAVSHDCYDSDLKWIEPTYYPDPIIAKIMEEINDNTEWDKIININPSEFNIEDLSIDNEDDLTGHTKIFKSYPEDLDKLKKGDY